MTTRPDLPAEHARYEKAWLEAVAAYNAVMGPARRARARADEQARLAGDKRITREELAAWNRACARAAAAFHEIHDPAAARVDAALAHTKGAHR